jgi:hypothetical protein
MLSELHSLNLQLGSKQYNKNFVLHLIVVTQLSSGWQHNYSTKTRQADCANEQSMYSLMSMHYTKLRRLYSDEHPSLFNKTDEDKKFYEMDTRMDRSEPTSTWRTG